MLITSKTELTAAFLSQQMTDAMVNKSQQEGIPTKPVYKQLFILILQKTSNNS